MSLSCLWPSLHQVIFHRASSLSNFVTFSRVILGRASILYFVTPSNLSHTLFYLKPIPPSLLQAPPPGRLLTIKCPSKGAAAQCTVALHQAGTPLTPAAVITGRDVRLAAATQLGLLEWDVALVEKGKGLFMKLKVREKERLLLREGREWKELFWEEQDLGDVRKGGALG